MASLEKVTTPLDFSQTREDGRVVIPYRSARGEPAKLFPEYPGMQRLLQVIRQWYPGLDRDVYFPSYFCAGLYGMGRFVQDACPYHQVFTIGMEPEKDEKKKKKKKKKDQGTTPLQYSDIKNDEAQQRMLWTFAEFCERKNKSKDQAAFILSNMSFKDYMCYYIGGENVSKQAEADLLVFDRATGITILEIKSTGDDETVRQISEEQKVKEVMGLFKDPKSNSNKLKEQLQRLMDFNQAKDQSIEKSTKQATDLSTEVDIRLAVLLPNTERRILKKALESLDCSVIMPEVVFLCLDDLPTKDEYWRRELTSTKYELLLKFWETLKPVSKKRVYLTSDEPHWYPHIVAKYVGPLTSVCIYSNTTTPRLGIKHCDVRFEGSTAQAVAERFSWIVLHETQIKVLEMKCEAAQFVHLEGPPGTGKTVTLLIRVLTWLDEGHVVWLVSLSPQSRSVTHNLHEQAKRMLLCLRFNKLTDTQQEEYQARLRTFIMNRPPETCADDYFEKRLKMFSEIAADLTEKYKDNCTEEAGKEKRGKVCVVMDETLIDITADKCHIHHKFFESVSKLHKQDLASMKQSEKPKNFQRGLSVWSAALHRGGRPAYVTEYGQQTEEQFGLLWELKFPMRCPPAIQRALMCVQESLDKENVCCFKKENSVAHPVDDNDPMGPHNHYVSDGVPVKLIAHGRHMADSVWECSDCGKELEQYLNKNLQLGKIAVPPEMRDESIPSDKFLPLRSVLIVSTKQAQKYQTLNSGFSKAMAEGHLEMALSAAREEGDAPIPDFNRNVITVSDITSIHGLERAVVIVIPDVKPDVSVKESAAVDQRPLSEEERYRAAFGTLNVECRKDLFYIGSRSVCKLIVFHRGKELRDDERASSEDAAGSKPLGPNEEEPMETSEAN